MVVEAALVVSVASLAVSLFFSFARYRRNADSDARGGATQLTTVIVKLDLMQDSLKNLERDLRDSRIEMNRLHERVTMLERSFGLAHPDMGSMISRD